jgi:hypothetical protein
MKKNLISILAILITLPFMGQGQDLPKQREIGLIFTGLNSFGLTYRQGDAKGLHRFRIANIVGDSYNRTSDSLSNNSQRFSVDLRVGAEHRKALNENFTFRYGLDLGVGLDLRDESNEALFGTNRSESSSESQLFSAGFNMVLGVNFQLTDKILLGAEVLPGLTYTTGQEERTTFSTGNGTRSNQFIVSNWSYQMRLSSILLSAVYIF